MILISIISGVAFFLILVLVAVHIIGKSSSREDGPSESPVIHASGIYSIVRRSPREIVGNIKPSMEQMTKYLAEQNVDINGQTLTEAEKSTLLEHWQKSLEVNIKEIETGDDQSTGFYYYDFTEEDSICKGIVEKGNFVTREEIFRCPQIIPPFHIGCRCVIKAHHGSENLRETTKLGMRPFFTGSIMPHLPQWKKIIKLT